MPKTKRYKKISLTNTKKKGLGGKQQLVEGVREAVEKYSHLYLFSVQNMRNNKLKFIRNEWKDSRFFLGKNRVIAIALGRSKLDECRENVHEISKRLKGQCGILFTDKAKDEVLEYFNKYVESDYARAGNIATETVILQPGPLEQFPFNMEPALRKLGLPTSLQRGVVTLLKETTVCKAGAALKPEEARLLKLLCIHQAEFKVTIEAVLSKDGAFEDLGDGRLLTAEDNDDDDSDGDDEMKDTEISEW